MADEHVFAVKGSEAVPARPISLAEAGLTERGHLQEWVIAHPQMLGAGVMVVTLEFDRWRSAIGAERDRLDVLGLDRSGRLVVAELKRDAAPETVEMQALKYAAMASRFTPEVLAVQHARYLTSRGQPTDVEAARERLEAHTGYELAPEVLAKPRIVLLASSFPPIVTATTVWLNEMSLDISLIRLQAYEVEDQLVVTVSQLYPVPDVEDFTVAPVRSTTTEAAATLPEVPWTREDLARLMGMTSATVLAALDLASERPGEWIPLRAVEERAGREPAQARADLAVLTMTVKRHFARSNWPFAVQWAAGGEPQSYYTATSELAADWLAVARAESAHVADGATRSDSPTSGPAIVGPSADGAPAS